MTAGTSNIVTTVGVGLQQVDLDELAKWGEFSIVSVTTRYPIVLPYTGAEPGIASLFLGEVSGDIREGG